MRKAQTLFERFRLSGYFVFMGLVVLCLRVLGHGEGGFTGPSLTRGRVDKSSALGTDLAKELALEAGRTLCLAGGN